MPNTVHTKLRFTKKTFGKLEELGKKLQCSQAETIGYALGLLGFVTEKLESGEKMAILKKNGALKEIVFPFKVRS